jgi:ABC-type multidrug transport system fused ATPase/permease subunit
MKESITVEDAIKKGKWLIDYPAKTILFTFIIIGVYLQVQNIITGWLIIPVVYILPFFLACLYWSITITKWRNWAFENVRNVHELKKTAIQERLIGKDNSIYQKFEIKTPNDKIKWNLLQSKFDKDDVFHNDPSISKQTIIFYSKIKNLFQMLLGFFCIAIGIYLLYDSKNIIFGILILVLGIYISYKDFREAFNTTPQIILDDNGIETVNTKFYNWENIKNEEVIRDGYGKHTHYYLVYDYPNGKEYLKIDDYNTNMKKLNKLLILYKGRSMDK